MTRRGLGARADEGTSTVEMAIMLPVLLLLLLGVLDTAISINAYATITNASREATQYAIDHPTAAPSAIASVAASRSVPLARERMTVNASYYDGSTFRPWPLAGVPTSSPSPTYIPVRVEVSYPWSAVTVLIGNLVGSVTLQASSTMQVRR